MNLILFVQGPSLLPDTAAQRAKARVLISRFDSSVTSGFYKLLRAPVSVCPVQGVGFCCFFGFRGSACGWIDCCVWWCHQVGTALLNAVQLVCGHLSSRSVYN